VKVFDEVEHVCRANETFESLSKQYYMGSPSYAKALQRHNQQHPRANDRMAKTGQIVPGEKVFIPQAYILEQGYPDTISKQATSTPPTTVPATFVPQNGSPPPIDPPTPPPALPTPLPNSPTPNPK
jgi:hypothetical protein